MHCKGRLFHAALAAYLLVKLRAVPLLGGLTALLATDTSDLAVKIGTVLFLGGLSTLAPASALVILAFATAIAPQDVV